jgi:hypothetical protein
MKARQKTRKAGLHVVSLPPEVADIYTQMHQPRFTGQRVSLRCPYCKNLNIENMPLCCDSFRAAIVQIRDTASVPVMVN